MDQPLLTADSNGSDSQDPMDLGRPCEVGVRLNMKRRTKQAAKRLLGAVGVGVAESDTLATLKANARSTADLEFLRAMPKESVYDAVQNLPHSRSQVRQDLFVLSELEFKTDGFFVEFGATNGVDLSNTYLLEERFGWNGILAEPATVWHDSLAANRSCRIVTDCVWPRTGEIVSFNQTEPPELSTVDRFTTRDHWADLQKRGNVYDVPTVSLMDLLSRNGAPRTVDYLSIDTEGSEFEILSTFDFDTYRFSVITCEHNFTPSRSRIHGF